MLCVGTAWALLSLMIGNSIMEKIYRESSKKSEEGLFALLVHMILGTVIGARLGHVLFYDPGYYFSHLSENSKFGMAD